MCTQELLSNVAPLSANAFSFVLSPGAQMQTRCFVGSAGRVCRCVTRVYAGSGILGAGRRSLPVDSGLQHVHTQGFRSQHGAHPRGQNQAQL